MNVRACVRACVRVCVWGGGYVCVSSVYVNSCHQVPSDPWQHQTVSLIISRKGIFLSFHPPPPPSPARFAILSLWQNEWGGRRIGRTSLARLPVIMEPSILLQEQMSRELGNLVVISLFVNIVSLMTLFGEVR